MTFFDKLRHSNDDICESDMTVKWLHWTTMRSLVFLAGCNELKHSLSCMWLFLGGVGWWLLWRWGGSVLPSSPQFHPPPASASTHLCKLCHFSQIENFQVRFLFETSTTHFYLLLLFNNWQMRSEKSAKVFPDLWKMSCNLMTFWLLRMADSKLLP